MYKPSVHLELNLRPFMKCVWSFFLPPKPIYRVRISALKNPVFKYWIFWFSAKVYALPKSLLLNKCTNNLHVI